MVNVRPGSVRPGTRNALAPPKMAGTRVKSAKELRQQYVDLQQSPDGMDPDPLTVPKCVECGHCGWPVYPRESKVATKKTYARAGIIRGTKKEEEAKRREEALAKGEILDDEDDDEEGEEGSEDSRDTEEQLRDELEDAQDKIEELEKQNKDLIEENEEKKRKIEELEATVEEQQETIALMEEAEMKWRELLNKAELRKEELIQELERASLVSADRTAGLIASLLDAANLREHIAKAKKRRDLMLDALEEKLHRREDEDARAATLRLWRTRTVKDRLTREVEDVEQRRQREVDDLQQQASAERGRVAALKAAEARLKGRLRAAAHRLLARSLGAAAKPGAQDHALRAWCGAHPAIVEQNLHDSTRAALEEARALLDSVEARHGTLKQDYDRLSAERDQLAKENADMKAMLEDLGGDLADAKARREAQRKREEALKKAIADWEEKFRLASEAWAEDKEELEQTIKVLESRLEVAEAAAAAGAGGAGGVDEASRVVPKGQGVLCVGCLKQLLHRGVQPLPPVPDSKELTASKLERAKQQFFEKELGGAPNPDDPIHTIAYSNKKDPYGISRLTIWPTQKQQKGLPARNMMTASQPLSPTNSFDLSSSPQTGLPALRKARKLRADGAVSPLKMTMRDFRPAAGFR